MNGRVALAAAWTLSVLPIALERAGWLDLDDGGMPRLALALLAWTAIAGLPAPRCGVSERAPVAGSLAAALPVLATAVWLDTAPGGRWGSAVLALAFGLAMAALLALASELARTGTSRSYRVHALAWSAFVALPPLLHAALAWWASRPSGAPRWLERWSSASPLRWDLALAFPTPSSRGLASELPWAPLAVAGLLCAALALERRTSAARAGTP